MPNNLTDNEIKKALECCISDKPCKECKCPLYESGCEKDIRTLEKLSLDLINRQDEKINQMYEALDFRASKITELEDKVATLQAENESLKNAYKQCTWERDAYIEIENIAIANAKAEAYTEFAEKIGKTLKGRIAFSDIRGSVILEGVIELVDNLLKEMVGEDN